MPFQLLFVMCSLRSICRTPSLCQGTTDWKGKGREDHFSSLVGLTVNLPHYPVGEGGDCFDVFVSHKVLQ